MKRKKDQARQPSSAADKGQQKQPKSVHGHAQQKQLPAKLPPGIEDIIRVMRGDWW